MNSTLTRFRCSVYERIEADARGEIEILHDTATTSPNDQKARSAHTWETGAKRQMARRLNAHMRRCGVCR
jgi:hypothetical protein